MAKTVQPIPTGFRTITPHLTVKRAADYIDFLKRAFGAVERWRVSGPGGKLMHAEVEIGGSILMLNDEFPEFGSPNYGEGPWPFNLHLYVEDSDALFDRAVKAGCTATMPLADQFWGDRYGQLKDPFGVSWAIATHKEDLTPAEMADRQKATFGGGAA